MSSAVTNTDVVIIGGGVMGASGKNCATVVLGDRKSRSII
jgi:glycerol-3-phosphate dehydrogenase